VNASQPAKHEPVDTAPIVSGFQAPTSTNSSIEAEHNAKPSGTFSSRCMSSSDVVECLVGQHSDPHSTHNFSEADAESKAALEEERLVKAASRSVIKKVVATPSIERGPLGIAEDACFRLLSFFAFLIVFCFSFVVAGLRGNSIVCLSIFLLFYFSFFAVRYSQIS
jgi:hypothetical protein